MSHKVIKFKFTEIALKEYKEMSRTNRQITECLMRECLSGDLKYSEAVKIELCKLNVNSYIFENYLSELIGLVPSTKDGTLKLHEEEVANIYKCIRSVMDSKKALMISNISLELH